MKRMVNSGVLVWALCVTAFLVMGVGIPNVFVAGNTISSAQVNANFTAFKTAVDALELKTAATTRGNILGYAFVSAGGVLGNFFSATGGVPIVVHPAAGRYEITWPGENVLFDETARFIQLINTDRVVGSSSVGGGAQLTVNIRNTGGVAVDEDFWVLLIQDHNA
jgi:hypothetical protein